MRQFGVPSVVVAATAFAVSACGEVGTSPERCRRAEVVAGVAAASDVNVLSALVTATVRSADSVAVRFGTPGSLDSVTATWPIADGDTTVVLPVLGLLPNTSYELRVVAFNGCNAAEGPPLSFSTMALPADLPSYVAHGSNPSPGYVAFAAGQYGLVIDNTGRVVWYHRFPNGPGLNFQPQQNGRYAARPNPASPSDPGSWVEIDVLGNVTRTLGCAHGMPARLHDLLAEPSGAYWIMCDETRTLDLTSTGGPSNARVTGTALQHLGAEGDVLFEWSPFDHFDVDYSAIDVADRGGAAINWTHGNAFDIDSDGNLLVSFRNLSEITRIDTRTGAVLWRMGGKGNEFQFADAPAPPFARQHGLRFSGAGTFLVLDNLGDPAQSHARRYAYDETTRASQLVASYAPNSPVVAQLGGTTQNLPEGHVLVSYGNGGRVEEYDATGAVVWQIDGNPGYVFRAQRIRSLYRPGVGLAR